MNLQEVNPIPISPALLVKPINANLEVKFLGTPAPDLAQYHVRNLDNGNEHTVELEKFPDGTVTGRCAGCPANVHQLFCHHLNASTRYQIARVRALRGQVQFKSELKAKKAKRARKPKL